MKRFFVKILAMLLACIFVISGINFSIFASDTISPGNLGDRLVAMNVAITGRIKLWFYFADTQNVQRYVVEIPGEDSRTVYVSNMAESMKNGDPRRVLEVSLAAAQQAVKVKVTPYAANGTAGKPREYSVMDYANQVIDLAATNSSYTEAAEALKSMLNYGAMSQLAFDRYTDVLANKGLYFGATNPINNMSIDDVYGVEKMEKSATNPLALDLGNVNAYLKDSISLKFYLNYTCNKSALRVTIEDQDCGNEINSDETGDYILIDNIPATKFNYQYTVKVSDGTNTLTFKCSVLNYVKSLIAMDGTADAEEYGITEADINAAYSMFQYYVKMWEYVNKGTAEAEPVGKPASTTCDHKRSYVDTKRDYAEICSDCGKDITPVDIVENASNLANGVTAYFGTAEKVDGEVQKVVDKNRENYSIWNDNTIVSYPLTTTDTQKQNLTITNKNGGVYVQDTMDVYVKTTNGTYWSSNSTKDAIANIYRYGYYYYDIHAYGQNFIKDNTDTNPTDEEPYSLQNFYKNSLFDKSAYANDMTVSTTRANATSGNGIDCTITASTDPYIYATTTTAFSTATYNAVQITMTLESTSGVQLRYTTSSGSTKFTDVNMIEFATTADGQEHTYTVYFNENVDVYGLRLDFNGQIGEKINVKSVNFVTINLQEAPNLLLDRGLHTYTDKMHQVLSIVAPKADVADIEEIGMVTKIEKSTVDKLIVKDKNGEHTSINDVDWATAEYAGFDIKDVGVFGYILPKDDEHSGTITITDDGTNYVITQIAAQNTTILQQPTLYYEEDAEGKRIDVLANFIEDSANVTKYGQEAIDAIGTSLNIYNSPTAFYFGQRIYTDTNHTFDTFLEQAYIERNPLTAENIKIDTDKTPNATFDGYDAIRGMYAFTIPENIGFKAGFEYANNFHGTVSFSITGDEYDRNMYVMAYSYGTSVEGGAVLDKDDTLLPIPTEVAKNFNHEFEEPNWLWGDVAYSEVRIPVKVNAGETQELTVLQTYMNWGKYPLKQISTVQFFAPYYHLSTGVTESNCIANYYVTGRDLQTLPDHRAASAPFWTNDAGEITDPQHDNGGYHYFLQYTDSDGNKIASENTDNVIGSSGPTYADIDMTYVSDDGKIKVTYTHMEMPQTDENRAYYTMTYEVLEEVTINDFDSEFSFYSVSGYGDGYAKFGYWGTNGVAVNEQSTSGSASYVLGAECPYFDLYETSNTPGTQTADVSFLIFNHEFEVADSKITNDTNFVVNVNDGLASLSLNADGAVTLNEGDKITIYAIIMPWWNQAYRNGDKTVAPDKNVQDARTNTLVNPIVATYEYKDETVISDSFLPTVKSENGLDATFTIGHKTNNAALADVNVTFRVDGFKVLTTPKLYEKIGNDWVLVELSSANSVDLSGNAHEYDGYAVHYDADSQTYSYSFVTTAKGAAARTFRVLVDDTYVEWEENHSDLYFSADALHKFASAGSKLTSSLAANSEYVTLTNGGTNDPATSAFYMPGGSAAKYLVLKYRLNSNTTSSGIQFFMTTSGVYDGTKDNFELTNSVVKRTGTWQVMVIDIAALVAEKGLTDMVANSAGTYSLSSFRLDPFTTVSTDSIDIAYMAFCGDIHEVIDMNSDMDISDISYVSGTTRSSAISDKLLEEEKYADMNVVFVGSGLADIMTDGTNDKGITGATVNDDGTVTVTFASDDNDEYFTIDNLGGAATGKYFVMKYKTEEGLTSTDGSFWAMAYYTNTNNNTGHVKNYGLKADGQWHTLVMDLTKLGTGIADVDGKYYVTSFRADIFDALSANGSVDFEYIGFCDELTDIPSQKNESLEYSATFKKNVDWLYVDGDTSNKNTSATSVTGTSIEFTGWTGVAGFAVDGISYVVTDTLGNETVVSLANSESGSNRYYKGSTDIQTAVSSLGAGTVGYVVKFTADLTEWNGQTVTLSIRATVDGIATVEVYSVSVTVPKAEAPGWINGGELLGALSTGKFSGVLNDDGTVTITNTDASGDGPLNITAHANGLTPKYAIIKYKTNNHGASVSIYATTGTTDNVGGYVRYENIVKADGEWHTLVADLTKVNSGYTYGDEVVFLRLDICEGAVGYSMTIDHVYLCEDFSGIADELVDIHSGNNVDELYVDSDRDTNLKAESTITATTVYYKGWLRTNGFSADSVCYVITDAQGNETIVPLTKGAVDAAVTNTYYERTDVTNDAKNNPGTWSADTVGYGVIFEADLSAYAGQTVTISIRETVGGGAIVETYSVKVSVPSQGGTEPPVVDKELDVIFEGEDLKNLFTDKVWDSDITSATVNNDGTVTVKYGESGDRYFGFTLDGSVTTGKYVVIKYRTGLGVNVSPSVNGVYCLGSTSGESWTGHLKLTTIVADHKWHTLVLDLADLASVTESNGNYSVTLFRADFFDALTANGTVDFAYIGLCDDLGDITLGDNEYLEYGWQNWTASLDSITIDGAPAAHDSAANKHLEGSAGASDRYNSYTGGKWAWSGWFSVDGQNVTDISVCVTDEAGNEHWTSFGTPAGRSDLNKEGSMHAETNLGYTTGTLCYGANVSADLGDYAGQTVTVSVRVLTEDGFAVTLYSVFVTVPKSEAPQWISGAELQGHLIDGIYTSTLNSDGSLTLTAIATKDNYTNSFHSQLSGVAAPKYAVIRYKTTTETSLGMYARTASSTDYKYLSKTIKNDGAWHTVIFDLETVQYILGEQVTYLRIDTCKTVGGSITIDYVHICDEKDLPIDSRADYISGDELSGFVRTDCYDYVFNDDGTLTITGKTAGDNYFNGFQSLMSGLPATKYAVVRYKTTTETSLTILASTGTNAAGPHTSTSLINDGFWHIAVLDLTACSGYVVGDTFSFMRINTCKTVGSSITFDYVLLCDDLTGLTVTPLSGQYSNNVDYLYVNNDTSTNLKGSATISGTSVQYTGWIAVNDCAITNVSYAIIEANGNETIVSCDWNLNRSDISTHVQTNSGFTTNTVGCGGNMSADLSKWAGQTVVFSIRATTSAGYIAETFSVAVTVPAAQ